MKIAETFFTSEEKRMIEDAIHSVECCTTGEIAVVVVDSSDQYVEAEMIGGIFFGSLLSLLITMTFLNSSIWFYIPFSILLFFPCRFIMKKIPFLKISLTGLKTEELAVQKRALRAFYEKGLYKTKANTGVLFFISLLEHKVWVLADKGIYEKIEQKTLNVFALNISKGIKEGRACDALCLAIKEAGEILAKHFPFASGDTNELPNQIITN